MWACRIAERRDAPRTAGDAGSELGLAVALVVLSLVGLVLTLWRVAAYLLRDAWRFRR